MKATFTLSSLYSEYLESLSLLEEGLFRMEKTGNADAGIFRKRKRKAFKG